MQPPRTRRKTPEKVKELLILSFVLLPCSRIVDPEQNPGVPDEVWTAFKSHPSREASRSRRTPLIQGPFFVDYGLRLRIGSTSFVNQGCRILDSPVADVVIGEGCTLGPDVSIYGVNHPLDLGIKISRALKPSKEVGGSKDEGVNGAPVLSPLEALRKGLKLEDLLIHADHVEIGDGVWIGGRAVIL